MLLETAPIFDSSRFNPRVSVRKLKRVTNRSRTVSVAISPRPGQDVHANQSIHANATANVSPVIVSDSHQPALIVSQIINVTMPLPGC